MSPDVISGPLRSILSRQRNVEVLMDEVIGVHADKRVVRLKRGHVSYDYLVLATGIQYNYFGHDEWRGATTGDLAGLALARCAPVGGVIRVDFRRAN
ncbi:MAG TPA: hypothetical protein VI455_15720 [Terriglobia bacterium]